MNRFCRQCGNGLEPSAVFCDACGAQLDGDGMDPTPALAAAAAGEGASATTATAASAPASAAGHGPAAPPAIAFAAPRKRLLLPSIGAGAIALAALAYVAASPYLALRQVESAIERRAVGEIFAMVDREALKADLAQGAQAALRQLLADDAELGVSSNFMLRALADGAGQGVAEGIDKLLSPESLQQLEAALKKSDSVGEAVFGRKGAQGEPATFLAQLKDGLTVDQGYTGLNTFEVRIGHKDVGRMTLALVRDGFVGWKLAGIDASEVLPVVLREAGLATKERQLVETALRQRKLAAAQRWLAVLAGRGDNDARYKLAVLQLAGVPGQPAQPEEGVRNATVAAEQGHLRAAHVLARAYQDGVGVPADLDRALHWMQQVHRIEPLDRWAAAVAGLHLRKGDRREALAWMERAVNDPPHLTRAERSARPQASLVAARKSLYAQYAQDLRAAVDTGAGSAPPPRWVSTLAGAGEPHASGWGPLSLGMGQPDAIAVLGQPTRFQDNGRRGVGLVYDHFVPHGAYLELDFSTRGGLAGVTLSVLPEAKSLGLPLVGDAIGAAGPARTEAGQTALALGCPVDGDVLKDYMLAELDLFPTRARRVQVGGWVHRVCGNGFVAGVEISK